MKFLSPTVRRRENKQAKLEALRGKRFKRFAWLPVKTVKDIIIWLDYYWFEHNICDRLWFQPTNLWFINPHLKKFYYSTKDEQRF